MTFLLAGIRLHDSGPCTRKSGATAVAYAATGMALAASPSIPSHGHPTSCHHTCHCHGHATTTQRHRRPKNLPRTQPNCCCGAATNHNPPRHCCMHQGAPLLHQRSCRCSCRHSSHSSLLVLPGAPWGWRMGCFWRLGFAAAFLGLHLPLIRHHHYPRHHRLWLQRVVWAAACFEVF